MSSDGRGHVVPLYVKGDRLASLKVSYQCCLDSRGTWLAIHASSFTLVADVDRIPVLRFDYMREMHSAPHAHIQVNAHRGALSHLLSQAGHATPHDMSSLHIPVGGSRLRPCIEDLLQFLITECEFDSVAGWEQHVNAGRERWRRTQVAALARAIPTEAARVLTDLGYAVTPPPEGHPEESDKALHAW